MYNSIINNETIKIIPEGVMKKMLIEKRFREILEIVNREKSVTVQELMEILGTSESTIRRDLNTLSQEGKLVKVHGGAVAIEGIYAGTDA